MIEKAAQAAAAAEAAPTPENFAAAAKSDVAAAKVATPKIHFRAYLFQKVRISKLVLGMHEQRDLVELHMIHHTIWTCFVGTWFSFLF